MIIGSENAVMVEISRKYSVVSACVEKVKSFDEKVRKI